MRFFNQILEDSDNMLEKFLEIILQDYDIHVHDTSFAMSRATNTQRLRLSGRLT